MIDRLPRPRLAGFALGLLGGMLIKELGLRGLVSYWGPMVPLILILAVLGACLWDTRVRRLVQAAPALLALVWLVVVTTPLAETMARAVIRRDPPRAADAIFVLSSNVQPDGDPSPSALSRATRGLELLADGLAPRILVSEVPPPAGSYHAYFAASARRLRVPEDHVLSIGLVRNTHDEALRVAELFRERGWRRLLLVTSPTHSRRAAAAFEHAGVPEVISVPAIETLCDVEEPHYDDRSFTFGMAAHELLGLVVYRMRGWI